LLCFASSAFAQEAYVIGLSGALTGPNANVYAPVVEGIKLYIDPLSYQYLDGTEIDYVEGLHGSGFKFGNPNVKSLVYVAAYALDQGERVSAANDLGGGHTDVTNHLVVRPYPGAPAGDGDAYLDPARFHRLFAQDLPRSTTDFMGATQRPGALGALVTPQAPWRGRPSPAGTWSPSRTASSRRRPSGSWRPARTPRQSASTARTSR